MTPHYQSETVQLHHGDCIAVMRELPDNSMDSIVCDPPYGLGFMGKAWDDLPPGLPWAQECLRVLKPGGHLLAFGGTRTWHRLACAVEDAGFEMRDSIAWLYGSGFPKSLDVSKAIDKAAGAEREIVGPKRYGEGATYGAQPAGGRTGGGIMGEAVERPASMETAPATEAAQQWQGWGTALKPAFEPIVVARKPLTGTVAANVQQWGTGALNIDGCRIGDGAESQGARSEREGSAASRYTDQGGTNFAATPGPRGGSPVGRWPANVVLDSAMAEALDQQSGVIKDRNGGKGGWRHDGYVSGTAAADTDTATYRGEGGASRFFYVAGSDEAKQVASEHQKYPGQATGCRVCLETWPCLTFRAATSEPEARFFYVAKAPKSERPVVEGVAHATVKPLSLMRWLVRLVTPPGGTVLEPFAGSGTTVEAAMLEGFRCVAIEREAEYLPLILSRVARAEAALAAADLVEPDLFTEL